MRRFLFIALIIVCCHLSGQNINNRYIKTYPYSTTLKGFIGGKANKLSIEDNLGLGNLTYKVAPAPRFGAGIAYRWFSISSSLFKLGEPDESERGATNQIDFQWNFYLRSFTIDMRAQRYEGYFLENSKAIKNWESLSEVLYQRNDLVTGSIGGNVIYNFNHRKYSPKAIFNQTERQIKSAGSFSLGLRLNALGVEADSSIIPQNLVYDFEGFNIDQLGFRDVGIGLGYGYTFVNGKWFFNIGTIGFLVSQELQFKGENIFEVSSSNQINFQTRSALGYSNDDVYIGLTAVADQMFSNWDNSKNFIYTFSKTRFIFAKRIHHRPVRKEVPDIWK